MQGLDLVQNAQAALHHQAQLPASAPGDAVHQWSAAVHQFAGPACQLHDQLAQCQAVLALLHGDQADTVLCAVSVGEVVTPARNVHAQVLPEIDQLQCAADGVALRQRCGVLHAIQMQQQAPYRIGRAAAVIQQLCPVCIGVGVLGFADVLHEGVEQIVQQLHRQLPLGDGSLQRRKYALPLRCWRVALGNVGQFFAVGLQLSNALGGVGIAFVGNVIRSAGKVVDGCNGGAQGRRAQPRGNRKVLVVRDGGRRSGNGPGGGRAGWRGRFVHSRDASRLTAEDENPRLMTHWSLNDCRASL